MAFCGTIYSIPTRNLLVILYAYPIELCVHLLSGPLDLDFQTAGRLIQLLSGVYF